MSFLTFLFLIIIGPLKYLFEAVFSISDRHVSNPGFAIIILSIVVNILVFPLYHRADVIEKKERELEKKLKPQLDFLNKTFKGDERFMVVQTFYRQNNYSPIRALYGAIPLLLQIPFFIAAYDMLSNLQKLNGVSFGIIKNLGAPDAMFTIGGIAVNVLPILMTAINLVSGAIYNKGSSLKEKIQPIVLALVFLVLLYNSPAGLVFYWTLNNFFSLLKNVITFFVERHNKNKPSTNKKTNKISKIISKIPEAKKEDSLIFILAGISLALLIGLYIPASIVANSPLEFLDPILFDNPVKYIWYSFAPAIGIYVVWAAVIYYLASPRLRTVMEAILGGWVLFAIYSNMAYDGSIGIINANMAYGFGFTVTFSIMQQIIDIAVLVFVIVFVYLCLITKRQYITFLLSVILILMVVIPSLDVHKIYKEYGKFHVPDKVGMNIELSKDNENVVIIMLDRGCGFLVEDIFEVYPELQDEYDGFTLYPNTTSFGRHTYLSSPTIFGGYEYTPDNVNKRPDKALRDKHDEALSVLPVMFANNGFSVSVIDPPFAGYQEIPNTAVIDNLDGVECYYTGSYFTDETISLNTVEARERNLFCFSLYLTSPLCIRDYVYDSGRFNNPNDDEFVNQDIYSLNDADGMPYTTLVQYDVLNNLSNSTNISNNGGSLVLMQNCLTHEPAIYDTTDWQLHWSVNNEDNAFNDLSEGSVVRMMYYQSDYVSLMLLAQWFDFLKEEGVYDNTRIIIASDHGYDLSENDPARGLSESYNAILLVKDFNSSGFTVSDEFMTIAESPSIAVSGVIDNPVNPFTGNIITGRDKTNDTVIVSNGSYLDIHHIDDNVFPEEGGWYIIHGDVKDVTKWESSETYPN
ncbi:MAG: membrane protein insertase YidC [Saccharofermentans sp.]|nr:membrane protein insertase YidC [Saccharofermentans sp.]